MLRLYSYVVLRDYGFAPNPFHKYCTLATCKPNIRSAAQPGDIVLGTATVAAQRFPAGKVVFAMEVSETMPFDDYWSDERFQIKRPVLNGSRKFQYGDNIYHHCGDEWIQEDSHHSLPGGVLNPNQLRRDTSRDRVLISDHFAYWGGSGPVLPSKHQTRGRYPVVHSGVGHSCRFAADTVSAFRRWLDPQLGEGFRGMPFDW